MQWFRRQLLWGILLLAIGASLLVINMGWISPSVAFLWPSAVIVAGLWLVFTAVRTPRGRGLTAGVAVTAVGAFWLLQGLGWIREDLFLAILVMSLGAGMLLRGLFFRG